MLKRGDMIIIIIIIDDWYLIDINISHFGHKKG